VEINPLSAAGLYAGAKTATRPDAAASGNALGNLARDFAATIAEGETTATAAMGGGADMPALIGALAQSELAVETAVTIRDRVVEAYQEILRMPV